MRVSLFSRAFLSILIMTLCFPATITAGDYPLRHLQQQSQIRAVALVIDGSGSIDAGDFSIQKEGIKLSFQNEEILPKDGSVAVTVIQYAGVSTRVEVAYRLIEDNADITQIIDQVDSISQIGGSTNPGDGIDRASTVFNMNGNTQNFNVICLSTDGLRNQGSAIETALDNAKNTPVDVNKFSVIAIEDPPNYYANDFHTVYDPLVFGGGTVTVVENAVAYANTVGGCLTDSVELIGLEVNQAIQDWNNSVVLIEGKRTYVRAHVQPVGQNITSVFAQLHGTRNGQALPESPLVPMNPGLVSRPNAADEAQRSQIDRSLNFRLPSSWLEGTVILRLEGAGSAIECLEAAGTPDDCSVEVVFEPTDRLEVQFVNVEWSEGNETHGLLPGDLSELAQRLRAMYPIATGVEGLDWTTRDMNWDGGRPTNDDLGDINLDLQIQRSLDLCFSPFCNRIYYGALVITDTVFGLADHIPGTVASGTYNGEQDSLAMGRNVHAHELGHVLNQHHAVHAPVLSDKPIITFDDYKEGWCGEVGDDSAPDFPYTDNFGGSTVATIGPMNQGDDSIIYGLDTHLLLQPELRGQSVVSPRQHYEIMSYCGFLNGRFQWISKVTYERIRDRINDIYAPGVREHATDLAQAEEYFVIAGKINVDMLLADFRPIYIISTSTVPLAPTPGEFLLRLLDDDGNVIREIPFDPSTVRESEPLKGTFVIETLVDPSIKQAQVVLNNQILATTTATADAPNVEVVYPNGGENFSDGSFTIRWNATDSDSDSLRYAVQYSPDNGNAWQTLAVNWSGTTYTVEVSSLEETNQGRIRIVASDGFNSSSDLSDGMFSLPNHVPNILITSPKDGERFVGVQSVFFEGNAHDLEDGLLSGSSLVWTSDLDGEFGTGEELVLDATALSEGTHRITLTVTDSGGLTASASTTIHVSRVGDFSQLLPDLIIETIVTNENKLEITIKNQGPGPVLSGHDFWVDVYINPKSPPTQVNETWKLLGDWGLVWGVVAPAVPLQPGDTVTLSINDPYFWPAYSNFPAPLPPGTAVYAQVDSANTTTTYGGVLENHEAVGGTYNNIFGPVYSVDVSGNKLHLPIITRDGLPSAAGVRQVQVEPEPSVNPLPSRP